jgi:4-hydroxyphenylpyruvate dioxygenase
MPDIFPIRRIDHVRFFCGNAKQAADWYQRVFGFDIVAYAGLETGQRNEADYLLQQNDCRFLISTPLLPSHPVGEMLGAHGDFVRDVCFEVDDVDEAFRTAVARGAETAVHPRSLTDSFGEVRIASIHTYGDVLHTFLNRDKFSGLFLPGFQPLNRKGDAIGIEYVDHVVGNVELGQMNHWVD